MNWHWERLSTRVMYHSSRQSFSMSVCYMWIIDRTYFILCTLSLEVTISYFGLNSNVSKVYHYQRTFAVFTSAFSLSTVDIRNKKIIKYYLPPVIQFSYFFNNMDHGRSVIWVFLPTFLYEVCKFLRSFSGYARSKRGAGLTCRETGNDLCK